MFHFIGFILLILLVILIIGLSLMASFVRLLFGRHGRSRTQAGTSQDTASRTSDHVKEHKNTRTRVFDKDEGEYVTFEEIKE